MNKLKRILVIGGSGYVGSAILKTSKQDPWISATSLQRNCPITNQQLAGVKYVASDVFNLDNFKEHIEQSDVIVHSMGVLLDSTITKGAQPYSEGSYEKINFESAKIVADYANSLEDKKRRFIYLSANTSPPFIKRYLESKKMAEGHIGGLANLDFIAIRPGLILDKKIRPYITPLGFATDIGNCINKTSLFKSLKGIKYVGDFASNFEVDKSIQLNDVARAVVYSALAEPDEMKRVMLHDDIIAASSKLLDKMYDK